MWSYEEMAAFVLVFLLCFSAFFSASETAFMVVNRYRLQNDARLGSQRAKNVLAELQHPDQLLSVILLANTVSNYFIAAFSTLVFQRLLGEEWMFVQSLLAACVLLLVAELLPKNMAALYPEPFIYWACYGIRLVRSLTMPIIICMRLFSQALLSMLGQKQVGLDSASLTRDELQGIISTGSNLSPQHQDMLSGVLALDDLTVNDIMLPRHEMLLFDINAPWEALLESLQASHLPRFLFYRGKRDQLLGMLDAKALLNLALSNQLHRSTLLQALTPVRYVPEGTAVRRQLDAFQQGGYQLGIVVDEYGEISGMVTLQDIMDEVIRSYEDNQQQRQAIRRVSEDCYCVHGQVPVRDFNRISGWSLPTNGPITLSGMVVETLETFPVGCVSVRLGDYVVEVTSIQDKRLEHMTIHQIEDSANL